MSVEVIHDKAKNEAAMTCTTSGFAFGPVASGHDDDGRDAGEQMEAFFQWLITNGHNPRRLEDPAMERLWLDFLTMNNKDLRP